ncbi:MAG: adenine phosphoribosyltransferase [Oscillospiraceae bacterium]|nr:adenine phosphoribosyltransferase [Oscillospiraceae bacterium]MCL2278767.1 adenine phosphoribosyltransferase [Oscillospiraceae bacterium]
MKEFFPMKIAGLERNLPICPINENISIAAFVLFGDVEMTVAAACELLKVAPKHDIIITAEAKGIPLVHEMAKQNGESTYIVARKIAKLYMKDVFEVELHSITTAKQQTLCIDSTEAEMMKDKNVLIVDDVISTGESLRAVEKLVLKAGGNIVGKMAVLAEGDAHLRDDIIYLEYLPLLNSDGSVKE